MQTIYCCIVDDHCDIVPYLHSCWKSKKIPLENILLIHVDSHPDLSPPPISVNEFSDRVKLCEALEQVGGISEFILPLVYNGHLNEVVWVKPNWSDQIDEGHYPFYLGDHENQSRVSLEVPYYFDEGNVYASEEMSNCRTVNFSTVTVSTPPTSHQPSKVKYWILDICLDYFTVQNPFIDDLTKVEVAVDLLSIITQMYRCVRFRRNHHQSSACCLSLEKRREEREIFLQLIDNILAKALLGVLPSSFDVLESPYSDFLDLFDCSCPHPLNMVTCTQPTPSQPIATRIIGYVTSSTLGIDNTFQFPLCCT